MGEKLKRAISENKSKFIVIIVLWIVLAIVFVSPLTMGIIDATKADGSFSLSECIKGFCTWITKPFEAFGASFSTSIGTFLKNLFEVTIVYAIAMGIGIMRAWPKSDYTDIEHGSSDWCQNGEEYKILSQKKGILLAEKHYLPVDKRGNVNILVIRRLWSW